MAFKIQLLADVGSVLRGLKDVDRAVSDTADSLDDLARETARDADKAGDALERSFSDAFRSVRQDAKKASRDMDDDIRKGTKHAGEGFDDLKDEANESAREAAASFTGEFEDVADYVQEVLAQALSGFGPIGAAAGIAAAAGIGILISQLQDAEEKAHEATERITDLANAIHEAGGDMRLVDLTDRINANLDKIVDKKEWWEVWQSADVTGAQRMIELSEQYNLSARERQDIMRGEAGDVDASGRAWEMWNARLEEALRTNQVFVDSEGNTHNSNQRQIDDLTRLRDAQSQATDETRRAAEQARIKAEADDAQAKAVQRAKESNERFSDSLKDNGSVLDDFAGKIVKGGKIIYSEWEKLRKKMRGDNKLIMEVDADPRLSPEARENFRNLPREVQTAIAKEFKKDGKKDDKVIKELNADAKVTVGKMDVKVPKTAPIEIPTTVADSGAIKGAQEAADKAQKMANTDRNKIEFKTKVNDDGLQGAVNRAAAAIHPPTIYVNVKARKEVP